MRSPTSKKGFTLIEIVVGTAVFLIIALSAYNAYVALIRFANVSQARILGVELADEQFEIIRNMPYVNVGLTTGIPLGVLTQTQTLTRGGFTFNVGLVIRNISLSSSTVQASTKLVQVDVDCTSCENFTPISLTGHVSPANLASAGNGGALVVEVFDAAGDPIQGATVVVQSVATSSITNTDVTNNAGLLNIIGVPPGANVYRVTVTKAGYSTARTYPIGGAGNPNPTLPDVTVASGTVTMVSLSIDELSTLNFSSVSPLCVAVPNFNFDMLGAKQIGASVPKYSQSLSTNGSGSLMLPSMEWDTYTLTPTDTAYEVAGITPFNPFALNPGNTQDLQFVVVPKNSRSLHVAVEDNVTGLPLSGATVNLVNGGGYNVTSITGQGYVSQNDWSGGPGQGDYTVTDRYYFGDGNIDTSTSSGSIVMSEAFGLYSTSATGTLESSTFDIGAASNFYDLNWMPVSQPGLAGATPLKLQFATNPTSTSTPWTYRGPDGTPNTFFTVPGTQVNAVHNGNQFARYAVYMTTDTATITPSVNNISFTYTSGCTPPGQVLFQGLSAGSYTLTVSKAGYADAVVPVTISDDWQSETVPLGL